MFVRPATPIMDAAAFRALVERERKRTDRSQRPLLLLLLDVRPVPGTGAWGRQRLYTRIRRALQRCLRQTDVIGWYTPHAVIGVLCTELAPAVPALGPIVARVTATLETCLPRAQRQAVTLSTSMYPPETTGGGEVAMPVRRLADRTGRV